MIVSIPHHSLLEAIGRVKTIVSARSALPILSHVLIEASEGVVRLMASDLKVSIVCCIDCEVEEPGSVTVSCQRLASVLGEFPEDVVSIKLCDNNIVNIDCGKIQARLFSMSPDEFPPIRTFEDVEPVTMNQGVLKKLFWKTSFAVCTDQTRYNLTGLLCEMKDGRLTVVATDGRRMSLHRMDKVVPEGVNVKVIVPGKMISELERLLGDEGDALLTIDEAQIGVEFGPLRLVSALIEGTFPNYETVIPKKHDKEVIVETTAFINAVRRTRTMTNEKFNSVRFSLSRDLMVLRVVTPEVGEYTEELSVTYDGNPIEVAFNPDFILDVLKRVESDKVCFTLKDGSSPCILKPVMDGGKDDYVNIIMPIRI